MKTIEELRTIVAAKPEGATHVDEEYDIYWRPTAMYASHSLSDIETIIKQADEIAGQQSEIDGLQKLVEKQAAILTKTANALKGEPDELIRHSHHDVGEVALELKVENAELRKTLKGASDYLDTNELTSIKSTSLFHAEFKRLAEGESK